MVFKNYRRDYKYQKVCSEPEEIFSGTAQSEHQTSHLCVRDLIMTKGKRKKRTWIIAGIVCTIVVALVVAAIVLLTTSEKSPEETGPTLALEDLLQGKLNPSPFNGTWLSDKELLYTDASGNLVRYTVGAEKPQEILLRAEDSIPRGGEFELSADGKYLKVAHGFEKVYRHSYRAKYTMINLGNVSDRVELHVGEQYLFLLAVWAPQGNALAFVLENNIYYKPSVEAADSVQITKDGPFIYNGIPDWVYEEEVFSSNKALWFSNDGTKLAYGRFDDAQVNLMVLPIYGEPGNMNFQYPRANIIKYPKAGTKNPIASLHCVNLNNVNNIQTLPAPSLEQPILSAVSWPTNDSVLAIWMNRIQNKAFIDDSTVIFQNQVLEEEPKGWLELFTPPVFTRDGSQMALILSSEQGGDLGAFRHVVLVPRTENSQRKAVTKGAFVVTEILGWHHDSNRIFYLANTEAAPSVQHLYGVSVDDGRVECLSCGVKSKNKQLDCLYNVAEFSKDLSHFALTCAGPDVPDIALYTLNKEKVAEWDENKDLQVLTRNKSLPTVRKFTFDIAGGFKAQVSLKLPPNFDPSIKYPMLVNVYAGPDSFQVTDKFNLDWGSYLAANKSIIYATIDGRGSGLKGNNILFASYRSLGTVEITDQIDVTKQLQDTLSYVDSTRTAIWGWSYGGYAAGMILAEDKSGIFKCGISVAPVTDWRLYDSIYTERFMGLPTIDDNYVGYRNANLLYKAEGLRDKQYFLIHGTYDDNVHYQQSMLWARVLEQNDILFRQLTYPDEDHGLGSVRTHLYHSLEQFLDECFIKETN